MYDAWQDIEIETMREGLKDLEQMCQELAAADGPNDPLVQALRRAIDEEQEKLVVCELALA